MKPGPFAYHSPTSVEQTVATLGELGHDGKVLAGGQSLIPILSMRLAKPAHLVDINRVVGLDQIEVTEQHIRVGATVRHSALERDGAAYAAIPLLRQALECVAHPAIRNRGTTVGSIAHADAAGEMPAVAALTEAVMEVVGPRGRREVAAGDFFEGALETVLDAEELLEAVRFGRFPEGTRTAFIESARRQGDYALAGVAVALTVIDGVLDRVRASYVSVTDVPGVLELTEALRGQEPAGADWSAVDDLVQAHIAPEADIHATADYRRMLAGELTRRALTEAAR